MIDQLDPNMIPLMQGPMLDSSFGGQPSNGFNPEAAMMGVMPGSMPQEEHEPDHELMEEHTEEHGHFDNILDILTDDDLIMLKQKIWPQIKRAHENNMDVKTVLADIIPLLSATIPNKSTFETVSNGGDSAVRNSGSMFLYSSALFETLMSIAQTILSLLLLGDNKFEVKVASHLEGKPGIDEVANRVRKWCNSYFSKGLLPGYKEEFLTGIMITLLEGECVRKIFDDQIRGNPRAANIMPGDYFFTSGEKSFYELKGFVHKFLVTHDEMEEKVESGEWSRMLTTPADLDEDGTTNYREAVAKVTGRTADAYDDESDAEDAYTCFEYYNYLDLEGDPLRDTQSWGALPYRVIFGDEGVITAVHRQWMPNDALRFECRNIVRYQFLPSVGDYPYGLGHVSGQRARAATVLQRSLVDSAQLSTTSTGFFRPYGRQTERTFDLKSGQYYPLGGAEDDIRKSVYTIPYNDPSPVLMNLLQSLENDIKKFSHIVNADLMNLATQAPAASLLAVVQRLEQLPNAIIQGVYDSFSEELRIFKKKFYEWLPANQFNTIEWQGEILQIAKEDFSPGIEITPCGKFSAESNSSRLMRAQLVLNQALQTPQFHNVPLALKNFYKDVGMPDEEINKLVVDPQAQPQPEPPPSLEPASENARIITGQPVQAYPDQDHTAHKTVHSLLLTNQDPTIQASVKAHIQHHEALEMLQKLQAISGVQLPPETSQLPVEQQNMIATEMAKAAIELQKMQSEQAGIDGKTPIDPALVGFEEIKAQREQAHIDAEIAMRKIELEKEKMESRQQIDLLNLDIEREKNERERMRLEADLAKTRMELAIKVKELDLKSHDRETARLETEIDSLKGILDMEKNSEDFYSSDKEKDENMPLDKGDI